MFVTWKSAKADENKHIPSLFFLNALTSFSQKIKRTPELNWEWIWPLHITEIPQQRFQEMIKDFSLDLLRIDKS